MRERGILANRHDLLKVSHRLLNFTMNNQNLDNMMSLNRSGILDIIEFVTDLASANPHQ